MKRHKIVTLASVIVLQHTIGACALAQDQTQGQTRERARDRIVHIEPGIIREIPQVPRLCDAMDLRKERVNVGDCNLYCEQEGRGTTLVLISGGPGATHHHFHPWFSRAADFARVICYDQRGCGLSDYRPGKGYSIDQAVDDLDHLRRALGIDRWVPLGHSYGGLLAQCYAMKHPERIAGLVLVCASTGLPLVESSSRDGEFISRQEREKMDQIRGTPGLSMAQIVYNIHLNGDWKRQNYYKPTREQIAQGVLYGWVHDNNFNGIMSRSANGVDLTGCFAQCPIATLIVEGKWDMSWGEDKPGQFHRNHPNARLVVFEESAHSPFEDEPDRFFDTLEEFIGNLPQISAEKLESWKDDLAARQRNKGNPLPEGKAGPEEIHAMEEFRRIRARIAAGESFEDTSTPLHAALAQFSRWEPGQMKDYFASVDILRAPLPPENPQDGSIWPIFVGSEHLEDTFFVAYSKGQWIWAGNMGCALDWRPYRSELEEWARQQIQQRDGVGNPISK